MKVTTFTDTMIKKLKPEEKKYVRGEGNGFTIRVMPSGVKTWLYVYAFDGKRREMNLGGYPDVKLEDARGLFEAAKKKAKNGIDPIAEKKENADKRREALTVTKLVEEYITKHAKVHKRSWQEDERILNKEVIPLWGKIKAADIKKRDVNLLLEKIMERGSPGMSNNTFQVVRKMFNFAVERDILLFSPATGVKAHAPKVVRDRALSADEIKTLWVKLDTAAISGEIKNALKLILVTAQRPGEVIGMHTSEINGDWWTIPTERAKNGKAHRVFLTPTAKELIAKAIAEAREGRKVPADKEYSGFIFPCPHKKKEQSIDVHAVAIAVNRNMAWPMVDQNNKPLFTKDGKPAAENKMGVDKFTPHDLRRTAATVMSEMGYMDEIIDAVLNHAKQGIIKVYNQNKYDNEKQKALEAWERKLNSIITGKENNVIPLIQKAA